MVFDLYFSDTNGSSWFGWEMGLTLPEYEWNTTEWTDANSYMVRIVATANGVTGEDSSDAPFELDNFPDPTYPPPDDLTLLVLAIAGVIVIVIVLVLVRKRKK